MARSQRFVPEETFAIVAAILPWLQQATAHFCPDSTYARSLSDEVRVLATRRLFRLPATGARVRCPHCGAPRAAPPGMEELFQFICSPLRPERQHRGAEGSLDADVHWSGEHQRLSEDQVALHKPTGALDEAAW